MKWSAFLLVCMMLMFATKTEAKKLNEDSVLKRIAVSHDTLKINSYLVLIRKHNQKPNDSALVFEWVEKAKAIAERLQRKKDLVEINTALATYFKYTSQFDRQMVLIKENLKISEEIGYKKGEGNAYLSIGLIHNFRGQMALALTNYLIAEKIFSEGGFTVQQAICLNNIAEAYATMKDIRHAIEYHHRTLSIHLANQDTFRGSISLLNLANIYSEQKQYDSAEVYADRAVIFSKAVNDHDGFAEGLSIQGLIYMNTNRMAKAIERLKRGIEIIEDLGANATESRLCYTLAQAYVKSNDYPSALIYARRAYEKSELSGILTMKSNSCGVLSMVYEKLGDFKNAYHYHQQFKQLNDFIINHENITVMQEMQTRFDSEKKESDIKLLNNENKLKEAEIARAATFRNSLFGIIGLGVILLLVLLWAFRNKAKTNAQLKALHREVVLQKLALEEKNKEILDSIHYAKRIQESLLTSQRYIERQLKQLKN